jgi:hypothetical protein
MVGRERLPPMRAFAANHVPGRCGHIRANIRAHRDIQSEHDARRHADSRDVDESGLLQK